MSDNYFDAAVSEWLPAIQESNREDELRRVMKLFAKEIERECRHRASQMAATLSDEIHNMTYGT